MEAIRGKRVLVTGGARGIGLCTAREFAREGAEVILTDIDADALEAARQDLDETCATVHARKVDVSDRKDVEALAAWVLTDLGGLDILINNAGIGHHAELRNTSLDTWRKLIEVNLMGPLHHVYAFLPSMLERKGGQIVNVSSGQAFFRLPTWGAYAAIKAALGVFSEVLHYEVRRYGIRVTTVYPFMVNTGFYNDVESKTFGSRMSMKLLPYYSTTPEKAGRIIFEATVLRKRVEMASFFNTFGFYAQVIPFARGLISRTSNLFLSERS
jgi:NAD(P)-dependent dehydrogenase (short-subunit alcohol dehydrogenase family)